MVVEPVHLHPFYALIDSCQQKQESRQCGTQYGACEWDTSDQRSRMMTRSVRVLCSWLTVGTSWIYSKCKYYFLRRNCDLPLLQLPAAYILYIVPKQPCFVWVIIPLNCYSLSQKATPTDSNVAPTCQSEPPMHRFPILSSGWAAFLHSGARWGSS